MVFLKRKTIKFFPTQVPDLLALSKCSQKKSKIIVKIIKKYLEDIKSAYIFVHGNQLQTWLISSNQVFFMFGVLVWGIVFWETSDDVSFFGTYW